MTRWLATFGLCAATLACGGSNRSAQAASGPPPCQAGEVPGAQAVPLAQLLDREEQGVTAVRLDDVYAPGCQPCPEGAACSPCEAPEISVSNVDGPPRTVPLAGWPEELTRLPRGARLVVLARGAPQGLFVLGYRRMDPGCTR